MILLHRTFKLSVLWVAAAIIVITLFFLPRFPQPLSYHDFADQRNLFWIPNAFNVLSNIPLFFVGLWGLIFVLRWRLIKISREELALWGLFFGSVMLAALFSAYYHLKPNNVRLSFDRVFLSLITSSFLSIMIVERIGKKRGIWAVPFLIILSLASVFYWILSEFKSGDLRFYVGFQFGSILFIILLLLLFPSELHGKNFLFTAFFFFVLAKLSELFDRQIYMWLQETLSGHTLKHLFAAVAVYYVWRYLNARKFAPTSSIEPQKTLQEALEELSEKAKTKPLSIKEIFEILSGKGRALVVIFLSIPFCQPIQIPGFSFPFGLLIAFISLRLGFGKHLWLPHFLLKKEVPSQMIQKMSNRLLRMIKKIKRWIHPRFLALCKNPFIKKVNATILFFLGLFLALPLPIPLSNLVAAWAIFFIALGILEDDGLLIILGYVATLIVVLFFLGLAFSFKLFHFPIHSDTDLKKGFAQVFLSFIGIS